MSFSLKNSKSILKYDDKQWKNNIEDRNVYFVGNNGIDPLTRDNTNFKTVVLIFNESTFRKFFRTMFASQVLQNEISLSKDVRRNQLFSHNIGRFVKDFTYIKTIGRGGFGKVYEAQNTIDLFTYAVKKVIFKHEKLNKNNFQQMLTEFRILATLNHSNIVRYHTAWFETETQTDANGNHNEESATASDSSYRSSDIISSNQDSCIVFGSVSNCDMSDVSHYSRPQSSESSSSISYTDESKSGVPFHNGVSCITQSSYSDISSVRSIGNGALDLFARDISGIERQYVLYIQMELCDGNLKDWLDVRNLIPGCMNEDDRKTVRCLARQLLSGIDYIHSNNVVHRDIKPANLLLVRHRPGSDNDLQLKIGDFGLAKSLYFNNEDDDCSTNLSANVGTTFYTAPEVIDPGSRNVAYNHKCDLYSVGIILVELMAKFKTMTELFISIDEIKREHRNEHLSSSWPLEAAHVFDLLSSVVAKRPSARFILRQTMAFKECTVEVENSIHELQTEIEKLRITVRELTQENQLLKMKELLARGEI